MQSTVIIVMVNISAIPMSISAGRSLLHPSFSNSVHILSPEEKGTKTQCSQKIERQLKITTPQKGLCLFNQVRNKKFVL